MYWWTSPDSSYLFEGLKYARGRNFDWIVFFCGDQEYRVWESATL